MTGENPLNRWHVSRTINIGHLLTTAVILVTVMLFFLSKWPGRWVVARKSCLN